MPIISNWFQKLPQNIPYGMFRFQFIPSYGESLYKFEQVATGAPTENIYISAGSTPTSFHLIIVFYVGSQDYSIQKFSRSMDGEVAGPPPAPGFIINLRRLDTTLYRRHNYTVGWYLCRGDDPGRLCRRILCRLIALLCHHPHRHCHAISKLQCKSHHRKQQQYSNR